MADPNPECKHEKFSASVNVNHDSDTNSYSATLRIQCAECSMAMKFMPVLGTTPDRESAILQPVFDLPTELQQPRTFLTGPLPS